jgi:DNA-directed RNA polymerase subunit RPC12/RpoP
MAEYFETGEVMGETPFKCYVCSNILLVDVEGEYRIKLRCKRCKTKIILETMKPLPVNLVVKHGELVKL